MHIDIEKLDSLPFRESTSQSLVDRYGCLYNLSKFDHPWYRSQKSEYAWCKAERIIKRNIGKKYDSAFSQYCKLVEQYEYYEFDKYFESTPYWQSEYIIDEQKRIQKNPDRRYRRRKEVGPIIFLSYDYKVGYVNIRNGETLTEREFNRRFDSWYYRYKGKHSSDTASWHKTVLSGFWKEFESEKDPEYIRLKKERLKQQLLAQKREKKQKKEIAYSFLSRAEEARKKLDALDKIKLQSHGFDETSFKGEEYHGQKRKKI